MRAARIGDHLDGLLAAGHVVVSKADNLGALFGEQDRNRLTQAARSTRHDHDLTLKPVHVAPFSGMPFAGGKAVFVQGSVASAADCKRLVQTTVEDFGRIDVVVNYMLIHWREKILNYFTYRFTNGFAEGKNNRIKAIIRAGYGYRNLTNLTQRIMLANPGASVARESYSPHFLT